MRKNASNTWEITSDSLLIGAGEYSVKSGDVVYWVYGAYADIAGYNTAKLNQLNRPN